MLAGLRTIGLPGTLLAASFNLLHVMEGDAPSRCPVVLLVDDDTETLDALRETLLAHLRHVEVLTCASAADALRVLRARPVDLLITDYNMPGMNGLDLLREADALAPKMPRMVMTAFPDLALALQAIEHGPMRNFITKPLDAHDVVLRVTRVLDEARAHRLRDEAYARSIHAMRELLDRGAGAALE